MGVGIDGGERSGGVVGVVWGGGSRGVGGARWGIGAGMEGRLKRRAKRGVRDKRGGEFGWCRRGHRGGEGMKEVGDRWVRYGTTAMGGMGDGGGWVRGGVGAREEKGERVCDRGDRGGRGTGGWYGGTWVGWAGGVGGGEGEGYKGRGGE